MALRTLLPAFLSLPLLGVLLAPQRADACSPPQFFIERTYPADAAVDVPLDGVVIAVGDNFGAIVKVEVRLGDVPVPGKLMAVSDHHVWRSDLPLLPDTEYAVHVEGMEEGSDFPLDERDFTFKTGAESAPALDPALADASAEAWDKEIKECVGEPDPGDCSDCGEWKVVEVQHRMRLIADVQGPIGPFVGFYGSRVAIGPNADELVPDGLHLQSDGGGAINHIIDLGPAGEWEGNEVCVRAEVVDPLGGVAQGEVSCIDISAINVEVPLEETTGGEETDTGFVTDTGGGESEGGGEGTVTAGSGESGDEPTESGGGSEGSAGSGESGDADSNTNEEPESKDTGCGCRSSDSPSWSGALLLLGLGLVRPRRRR